MRLPRLSDSARNMTTRPPCRWGNLPSDILAGRHWHGRRSPPGAQGPSHATDLILRAVTVASRIPFALEFRDAGDGISAMLSSRRTPPCQDLWHPCAVPAGGGQSVVPNDLSLGVPDKREGNAASSAAHPAAASPRPPSVSSISPPTSRPSRSPSPPPSFTPSRVSASWAAPHTPAPLPPLPCLSPQPSPSLSRACGGCRQKRGLKGRQEGRQHKPCLERQRRRWVG